MWDRYSQALSAGMVLLVTAVGGGAEKDPDLVYAEKTLEGARQKADGPALVKFFQKRTLSEADRKKLGDLVQLLGDDEFAVRQKAFKDLRSAGRAALPFLVPAQKSTDPEIARSAEKLVKELESGSDLAVVLAAARLLADRKPAGAPRALLAYLPMAEDESVNEAVLSALLAVGIQGGKVDPVVTAALKDTQPAIRAAAAFVHGQAGPEGRKALAALLKDMDARVRFHAGDALVRGGEKSAMPVLLALLSDGQEAQAWRAEALLFRIAGDKAPSVALGTTAEERKKCRDEWNRWWEANQAGIDLAKIDFKDSFRGLTVVCDCGTGKGAGGKLWEFAKDGKERWQFTAVQTPVDYQLLPGNRYLMAEGSTYQVSERDRSGRVLWSHKTNGYATTVKRLPNGNTLIGGYNEIMEVTRAGKVVFSHKTTGGSIYRCQMLKNGHLLFACNGQVVEIDRTGKQVRTINIPGGTGIWTHVEFLPNGRYLVAQYSANKVIEIDAAGKVHWQVTVTTPSSASLLPSGHVLVSAMDDRKVVEFNRAGKEVWKQATQGRPFLVRRY